MTLLDSYSESNQDTFTSIRNASGHYTEAGQAFTAPGTYELTSVKFYLLKGDSGYTGSFYADLYASTGTMGTNAVPTGGALATSNEVEASSVDTSYSLIEFTFGTPYEIQNSTDYVVVVRTTQASSYDASVGQDGSSYSHSGNAVRREYGGSWGALARDTCFYIYGDTPSSAGSIIETTSGVKQTIATAVIDTK